MTGAKVQEEGRRVVLQVEIKGWVHPDEHINLPVLLLHLTKKKRLIQTILH